MCVCVCKRGSTRLFIYVRDTLLTSRQWWHKYICSLLLWIKIAYLLVPSSLHKVESVHEGMRYGWVMGSFCYVWGRVNHPTSYVKLKTPWAKYGQDPWCWRGLFIKQQHGITYKLQLFCNGLLPDTQNCGLRMRRECRERFPRHRLQRKPLVNDPGMHHGTWRDACRDR